MTPAQPDKWEAFVEQINLAPELPEKFNLLAIMVRMLATNDLNCMEGRIDALSRKFDACMKKIYVVGVIVASMIFLGLDAKSILEFILKIVK